MGKTGKRSKLRALDLYSGVGGWSLGLKLAGIEVVSSYERWGMANETNFKNNRHQAQTVDIRRLSLEDLPSDISIVVGSPPCTQFSFANKGGNGDLDDGLEDIIRFLTIVDYLKPKLWAMENVPRVANILTEELKPGGRLARFSHLEVSPHVINMEDFGLPQRRQRCIAGNFNFELLKSYSTQTPKRTLGCVIKALAQEEVADPIYGVQVRKSELTDHITEDPLNEEEIRINMAAKTTHPVYNAMSFPDRPTRSVRTITATCTRVSRESIVIQSPENPTQYRRLTIRERASLQGFPITFQFYGETHEQKHRMVGNALPPLFSYYVAHALLGHEPNEVPDIVSHGPSLCTPIPPASNTRPPKPGFHFPESRKFRFAIPSLRLKSGVRFELANDTSGATPSWEVAFYFGTSKSIQRLPLDADLYNWLVTQIPQLLKSTVMDEMDGLSSYIQKADVANMQKIWSHSGIGLTTPFMLLDELDNFGRRLTSVLQDANTLWAQRIIHQATSLHFGAYTHALRGLGKLDRNAPTVLSGLLIGALTNSLLAANKAPQSRRKKLAAIA